MAGNPLGEIFGSSEVQQLFLWSVVSQLVNATLQPGFRAAEQFVNARDSNVPLSPAELATAQLRGHVQAAHAAAEAQKSGMNADNYAVLAASTGLPPGPQQLAEALRRGFIDEGSVGDSTPSYLAGIAQGDLRPEWAEVVKQLDTHLPSAIEAVNAAVRSILDRNTAQGLFEKFGGDAQYFQLLFDVTGEGPSPVEAGVLANRGIIPWEGTGADETSFAQAVAEGRTKNKWTEAYRALAVYYPPPRTTVAMWREGSIDTAQATRYLLQYGVPQELIPSYLTQVKKTTVTTAHQATEGEITRLYQEQAISRDEAANLLKSHGYSEQDIPIVLEYADLQVSLRHQQAVITPVHRLYTHGRIDANTAKTLLSSAEVPDTRSNYLLGIWELERSSGVKDLTVKEITEMWGAGLFDAQQALNKLMGIGYSPDDAALLIALYTPSGGPPAGSPQSGGQNAPVTVNANPVPVIS
jgi:hypothetical protein